MPALTPNIDFVIRALAHCGDGILITDTQLEPPGPTILWINEGYRRISGYGADELVGRTPRVLQGPQTERAVLDALKAALQAGAPFHGETWNYRKDGTPFRVEWDIAPVRDDAGKIEGYISVQRDVTRRYEAEERLKQVLGELERSNNDLSQYARRVSHDIRSPTQAILGYAELLEQTAPDRLDARQRGYLAALREGVVRMNATVRGLLELADMQASSEGFQALDTHRLIDDACHDLAVEIETSGADIRIRGDLPPVWGNEPLLRQVLQNLIANAIKYRRGGIPPRITVSGVLGDDGLVRLCIEDNGIGVPPQDAEAVFLDGHRLPQTAAREGTGTGLATVRRIVEFHGGRVRCVPTPPPGSVFEVRLPAVQARP